MPAQFAGRVALVTGAGAGIGRASALGFAREGARVVVSDVDPKTGEETAQLVRQDEGGSREALFIAADVSDERQVESLIAKAVDTYRRLDFAHNNAGIEGPGEATHLYPEDLWRRVMDVNLKGVWLCMKYEIRQMLHQGGGSIVNTASVAGLVASVAAGSVYAASKHGVVGLTKSAAVEYAQQGIRVNAVCPGVIQTSMVERIMARKPETQERFLAAEPVGRLGTPEEVAAAVVWLCSDAASFVTGLPMPVDGGLVAR